MPLNRSGSSARVVRWARVGRIPPGWRGGVGRLWRRPWLWCGQGRRPGQPQRVGVGGEGFLQDAVLADLFEVDVVTEQALEVVSADRPDAQRVDAREQDVPVDGVRPRLPPVFQPHQQGGQGELAKALLVTGKPDAPVGHVEVVQGECADGRGGGRRGQRPGKWRVAGQGGGRTGVPERSRPWSSAQLRGWRCGRRVSGEWDRRTPGPFRLAYPGTGRTPSVRRLARFGSTASRCAGPCRSRRRWVASPTAGGRTSSGPAQDGWCRCGSCCRPPLPRRAPARTQPTHRSRSRRAPHRSLVPTARADHGLRPEPTGAPFDFTQAEETLVSPIIGTPGVMSSQRAAGSPTSTKYQLQAQEPAGVKRA